MRSRAAARRMRGDGAAHSRALSPTRRRKQEPSVLLADGHLRRPVARRSSWSPIEPWTLDDCVACANCAIHRWGRVAACSGTGWATGAISAGPPPGTHAALPRLAGHALACGPLTHSAGRGSDGPQSPLAARQGPVMAPIASSGRSRPTVMIDCQHVSKQETQETRKL